jgi:hypothetical protein
MGEQPAVQEDRFDHGRRDPKLPVRLFDDLVGGQGRLPQNHSHIGLDEKRQPDPSSFAEGETPRLGELPLLTIDRYERRLVVESPTDPLLLAGPGTLF